MKPQFENLNEFLNMGGYGFYVWLSWGLGFFVILLLALKSINDYRKAKARLNLLEQENAAEK